VVDRKSALAKEFFHVTVGQREAQVPANRQQDNLRFELPPFEKTRNGRCEQKHRTSLSDHASKVATLPFYAKYACPGSHALSPFFEHPFARLGCFGRDRWNLWARRHNDQWICIELRFQTLRECFQSMRENPWFHF
jgi:hypothetical protein